jgi:putative chitinase
MNKTILNLQTKIGAHADGDFGPYTAKAFMEFHKITLMATAHLLGQCFVESDGFSKFQENLNYSAQGLADTWPTRFAVVPGAAVKVPNALALSLHKKPVDIANTVYANRNGNGDTASGDGWKYRGIGAIQLTGKSNVKAFADYMGKPSLVEVPDVIATVHAFDTALFFFKANDLFRLCVDLKDETVRRVSNGVNRGNPNSTLDPLHFGLRIQATRKMFNMLAP